MSGLRRTRWFLCIAVNSVFCFSTNCVTAQITPDSTLPENSRVSVQDSMRIIEGGTRTGGNLFHSFQEFSVPANSTAFFNNAQDIQNIISRVTGGSISNIDGLIRANGTANLFLINPNGIIFGQNASLNIGGSFLATTATHLKFGDGTEFGVIPQTTSLLTVSVPIGLQYGKNSQTILNQSQAKNSSGEIVGLRVQPGKTLAFVGGNVKLDGAKLRAAGGRVELGGLAESGIVGLFVDGNNLSLSYPESVQRADVLLENGAQVDVSASGGGSIAVNARKIDILGRSWLLAGVREDKGIGNIAGDVTLNATDAISLKESSAVYNLVNNNTKGNSGNIKIAAQSLDMSDEAFLQTSTYGQGNAGNVFVTANDRVSLENSTIYSTVEAGAVGSGGDINITAESLSLTNGSQLQTLVREASDGFPSARGNAGNVNLDIRKAVSISTGNQERTSGISTFVDTGAIGNAGDINIKAGSLSLDENTRLDASIFGQGNGGNVFVRASDSVSLANNSTIASGVGSGSVGNGGDITIKAETLSLGDRSFLNTSTLGQGDAGNIFVQTSGLVSLVKDSAIANIVGDGGVGNGGDITINAGTFSLSDRASLLTATTEQGNAGTIFMQVSGKISLANNSFIGSSVAKEAVGNGGDINISAGSFSLTNGAFLSANTSGQGKGGNVFIQASDAVAIANGSILTGVDSGAMGNGGDISIKAKTFSLTDNAALSTSVFGQGKAGSVFVQTSDSVSLASSSIGSSVFFNGVGQGGNINITGGSLSLTDGAAFFTGTIGEGNAGNVTIKVDGAVSFDGVRVINGLPVASGVNSAVILTATPGSVGIGKGGDINITAGSFSLTNGAQLSSLSGGQGDAGNVTIKVDGVVFLDGAGGVTIRGNYVPSGINSGVGAVPPGQNFGFPEVVPEQGILGNGKGGDITITAGALFLTNGAQLETSTAGKGNAGSVFVQAKDSVFLTGSGTSILSAVGAEAIGKGGDINITVSSLSLTEGAQLVSSTGGQGNAGSIFIRAKDSVSLAGSGTNILGTVVSGAVGKGGDINIQSRFLSVTGGAEVSAGTRGRGNAGSILVNATDEVKLSGVSLYPVLNDGRRGGFSSGLFTSTEKGASGQGGELLVTTDTLRISEGAVLNARSQSGSRGGNITVNANVLEVTGGGQILTTAFSSGDAGNINVKVKDRITISGSDSTYNDRFNAVAKVFGVEQAKEVIDPVRPEAGLFANTAPGSSGNGGSIFIDPIHFAIADGAGVAVDSQGTGKAGNLEVQAGSLSLDNNAFLSATANSGQGGNMKLTVEDLLLLRRQSHISTSADTAKVGTDVAGGNIDINTKFLVAVLNENSDITANAFKGRGGNVSIQASGIFGIARRDRDTPESDITASSDLGINGTVNIYTPDLDPSQGLVQLPANLVDVSQQVATGCTRGSKQKNSSFVATARGGIPPSPTESLLGDAVLADWVTLLNPEARDRSGNAIAFGDSSVNTSPAEIVEARGWMVDANNNVTLVATAPDMTSHNPNFISSFCSSY